MSDYIELKVDGQVFGGWTALQVTSGIEQLAGTFDLTVTELWPGASDRRAILPGMAVRVTLNDEVINTGWIDAVEPAYNERDHALTIRGRDKTGDLVDCSAIYKSGQWVNRNIAEIAADLLAPFNIDVVLEVDAGKPFASYNIQEGETVFDCLERAARMRALLLITDQVGNLVITRAGNRKIATEIVEGVNIKHARASFSWKERFSVYTVKGQARGDDHNFADAVAGASAKATDETISRYRPLMVHAEHHDGSTLADRATWEKNIRIGRGNRGSLTVQGWTHADGPWRPNSLVQISSPMLNLDAEMLIVSVTYTLAEGSGTLTDIAFARPDAFELLGDVGVSKLGRKLTEREKRQKVVKGDDWSGL